MAKQSKRKKALNSEISAKVVKPTTIAPPPTSWLSRDWLWGLILILTVLLTYSPVWWAGYVWDDDLLITTNPCIVGPLGLKEIWTTNAADICPLTFTVFWLEHALWGLAPLPYHLVNVLLHGACAVVLWRVLRCLQVPGAWLGAALWALHPVQVESVAWITEMKNTQSGLFFLLSIFFFVRWIRAKDLDGQTRWDWNYGLTLIFAALAMASKSSTVILPVVLCLCAWWVEGRWQWRNLARTGPIFTMSIAIGIITMWTQKLQLATTIDPQWMRTWPERLLTAGDAVCFYLGKLLWPHPLIVVYPRWQIDAGQCFSYLPLLAVIIVLFILGLKRKSWSRPWFFVFAYFLGALFPVLGLVDNFIFRYSLVFDHFQYLASMGPLALAGAGMVRWADFAIPGRPWLQSSLCAGVLLVLGMLSWQRAWAYESQETLWTETLAMNPSCWLGYNNLGIVFLQKGQADEAMDQFQKSLQINPNFADAHSNLGSALAQKGQVDQAMVQYQESLQIYPNSSDAHSKLGTAFLQKGQMEQAMAQFQKALEINPNIAEAQNNLGLTFSQKGQVDEAIAHFQRALEINPNLAEAHYNLGNSLLQKRQVDEARNQFQMTVEINPNHAEAHNNLGNALVHEGRVAEAIDQYQKALEINPNFADAHSNLGIVLFQSSHVNEAIAQFQEALRLEPNNVNAQNNLTKVQAMLRHKANQK